MRNYKFWNKLIHFTKPITFYAVVNHTGSSPGKTGFKMAIVDQEQIGTIGGGIMELNLIDKNKIGRVSPKFVKLEHNSNSSNASGLICSGTQTVFIQTIDNKIVKEILKLYELEYFLNYNQRGIEIATTLGTFGEKLEVKNKVAIFGAGHVGSSIANIMSNLDFKIYLFDHRKLIQTVSQAHIKYEGQYSESIKQIKLEGFYVIITTTSFSHDLEVLLNLPHNVKYKYIGLMGSKAKIKKIYAEMRKNNIKQEFIDQINAPIGLNISDGSAEEIAISVAAEVISLKNNVNN